MTSLLKCATASFLVLWMVFPLWGQEATKATDKTAVNEAENATANTVGGTATGDDVRVRVGPGDDKGYLTSLLKGDQVQLLEKVTIGTESWYAIVPPRDQYYIAKEMFDAEAGEVTREGVWLRNGPGQDFNAIGQVKKGQKFAVVQLVKDYYRVEPLPGSKAYVHASFIKAEGEVPGVKLAGSGKTSTGPRAVEKLTPPAEDVAKGIPLKGETMAQLLASFDAQLQAEAKKPLKEQQFAQFQLAAAYLGSFGGLTAGDQADIKARQDQTDELVARHAKQLADAEAYNARVEQIQKDQQEQEAKIKEQFRKPETTDQFIATGIVERYGLARSMPSITHKLVAEGPAGTIKVLMFSNTIDLDRYQGQKVGIQGKMAGIKAFALDVIEVTEVKPLNQ